MSDDPALMRLAQAAGLQSGYWDGLGTWRGLTPAIAGKLLAALGFDPAGDCEAQTTRLDTEACRRPLPTVLMLGAGPEGTFRVALPVARAGERFEWRLMLESGEQHAGAFTPAEGRASEPRDIDGAPHALYAVHIGIRLRAGYHRLLLPGLACETTLIVVPAACHVPDALAQGGRVWGLAVQLYALRSARNWGIGDFSDLARLAGIAGRMGAALIGLNPLHARNLARPGEASPYAPSSRLFLDAMYLDVEAIAGFAACDAARQAMADVHFQARLARSREAALVDHELVCALKLPVLRLLFDAFRALPGSDDRVGAFRKFREQGGADLQRFAEFEAARLDAHDAIGGRDFQIYLQWQAQVQLDAAAQACRDAGMTIGLYRDLAVGAARDGAEVASDRTLFAPGISVGAPPDLLNAQGQDWGLPPWNPRRLAAVGYRPFTALLAANMRAAGALRIDHVMALTRLFWIPPGEKGDQGGYVNQAFEVLAGIVALESLRNGCMVIGEDLGSVPDGLRERLAELHLLSYRVLIFERHWNGDGSFKRPWEYPRVALAMVATHDMPTIAEWWRGGDITRRDALGLFSAPQLRDDEARRRDAERPKVLALLGELGLAPADAANADQLGEALHAAIAQTEAMLAVVQVDDIIGEVEPVNIPGTWREYPNFRRKLSRTVEQIGTDARLIRLAELMRAAGRA